ncbi:MAG: Hsp20 family protein [Janthinobacterium lividum]
MRHFDFSPLYRSAIGFDHLARMLDDTMRSDTQTSYPPYNVELVGENQYRITMAIAGFQRSELEIEFERDTLKIVGRRAERESTRTYLHRGIAERDFEHRFRVADHVKVVSAALDNGILQIDLVREVPEALKPRRIEIGGSDNARLIEAETAA